MPANLKSIKEKAKESNIMTYKNLYKNLDIMCGRIKDENIRKMFRQCYLSTLETTVKYDKAGNVFVITGDIEAMWLRDSSVQVSHYVRAAKDDEDAKNLVKGLLQRQFALIQLDPYANAFNEEANGRGHRDDTMKLDIVWERKYEIDSLIYPLWLVNRYYENTSDSEIFSGDFMKALGVILDTLITEQNPQNSPYYFRRDNCPPTDTLCNDGKGPDYAYTGLVRSAFRPSDDACTYPFLVPANMFIVATLKNLEENLNKAGVQNPHKSKADKLIADIENAIEKYCIVETEFGRTYAYEVDGLGGQLMMDDANVPSLLSLPYLGYCAKDDEIYLNTRNFILSKNNPFYFDGKSAKGIGSPHTPADYIWHIALAIEGLTTDDKQEIERIYSTLISTHADTFFMHEGFHKDNPDEFTRKWFAWANTLFAIFMMDKVL